MATPFTLSVVTPEKVFFDGETTQIIVRTSNGDIGILAGHTSLVASLPSGPLKVKTEDGTWKIAAISTGVLKVGKNKVSILANAAEWADEIDLDWAKRSEEDARSRLKQYEAGREHDIAEIKLQRAINRISVKSMAGK